MLVILDCFSLWFRALSSAIDCKYVSMANKTVLFLLLMYLALCLTCLLLLKYLQVEEEEEPKEGEEEKPEVIIFASYVT